MRRQAGVVIPLAAIRSRRDWGIGQVTDLPAFAAWAARAGQRLVQILPPHELSAGETSPYGAMTAFGIDPIYADVDAIEDLDPDAVSRALGAEGLLVRERVRATDRAEYDVVRGLKVCALHAAFDRFQEREWSLATPRAKKLAAFIKTERGWLDDFALYGALRMFHGGAGWQTWPEGQRDRFESAIEGVRSDHGTSLLETAYVQWTLSEQWERARREMLYLGVELMGDVPFVVCAESADVWAHASQFQLGLSLGAPPDAYSADGQDWGLPPYDWLAMEADDLEWIRRRTRRAADLYDRFRLDHVVGYFRQWARLRGGHERGRFDPEGTCAQQARGRRVLGAMLSELSRMEAGVEPPRAIVEDLGVIPPFVRESLRELDLPGYRVLPWEKDGGSFRDPRAFPKSSVVSWSTHDTAPIDAWWHDLPEQDRTQIAERAGVSDEDSGHRSLALLRDLYGASSDLALVLAQELLGIHDRINTPATVNEENWTWRLPRPIEDLESDPIVSARTDAIRALVSGARR